MGAPLGYEPDSGCDQTDGLRPIVNITFAFFSLNNTNEIRGEKDPQSIETEITVGPRSSDQFSIVNFYIGHIVDRVMRLEQE